LPFGFVSPVQERLGRAPEASHGAETFLGFREKIDRETPAPRDPRLILANYAADETAAVLRWLASRKRFTPASCFWLNLVERRFAEIARQRLGVGPSTGPSNAIAPSPGGARGFDLTRIG
jgi:hypothetical protein